MRADKTKSMRDRQMDLLREIVLDFDPTMFDGIRSGTIGVALDDVLGTIPKQRCVQAIRMRFGLVSEQEPQMTCAEAGRRLGRVGETIRHNEAKGLRYLRHPQRRQKLKECLRLDL